LVARHEAEQILGGLNLQLVTSLFSSFSSTFDRITRQADQPGIVGQVTPGLFAQPGLDGGVERRATSNEPVGARRITAG
jgi:hypothetical protein